MLQLRKKLKLSVKLGPEAVSIHMKIYLWSLVDFSTYKSIFTTNTSYWTSVSSVKSIPEVILPGNTSGNSLYFDIIISPTWKKVKRFQTVKIDEFFFRNLDPHNSTRLKRKRFAGKCLIWKLMEYFAYLEKGEKISNREN